MQVEVRVQDGNRRKVKGQLSITLMKQLKKNKKKQMATEMYLI